MSLCSYFYRSFVIYLFICLSLSLSFFISFRYLCLSLVIYFFQVVFLIWFDVFIDFLM